MASHYLRKNGTYCVRSYYGVHNGVQKIVSKTYYPPAGMSQKAVEKDLARFEKRFDELVRSGEYVPGANVRLQDTRSCYMTVKIFIEDYYRVRMERDLSPNTVRFYDSIIRQFIIPSFGEIRLIDIRKEHLQRFVDYLAYNEDARADGKGKVLSPSTIRRYATVFRSVITEAYNMSFLEDNPFEHGRIEYPREKHTRPHNALFSGSYGMNEIKVFLHALRKEKPLDRILLLTSVVIGARRAEVVALKWEDVDFDLNCIYIDKSAYKLKGEKQALKAPKSEQGYRDIFFPAVYREELLMWKNEQENIRKQAGDKWNEQGFIFTGNSGDMINLYYLTRLCEQFEKKNEIRHLRLHGLRHTFNSILCSRGVSLATMKELLGHKSISTTEIYTHSLIEDKMKAADIMNDILSAYTEGEENGAENDSADSKKVSGD